MSTQTPEQKNKATEKDSKKEVFLGVCGFSLATIGTHFGAEFVLAKLDGQVQTEYLIAGLCALFVSNFVVAGLMKRWEQRRNQDFLFNMKSIAYEKQTRFRKILLRSSQVVLAGVTSGFAISAGSQIP